VQRSTQKFPQINNLRAEIEYKKNICTFNNVLFKSKKK